MARRLLLLGMAQFAAFCAIIVWRFGIWMPVPSWFVPGASRAVSIANWLVCICVIFAAVLLLGQRTPVRFITSGVVAAVLFNILQAVTVQLPLWFLLEVDSMSQSGSLAFVALVLWLALVLESIGCAFAVARLLDREWPRDHVHPLAPGNAESRPTSASS